MKISITLICILAFSSIGYASICIEKSGFDLTCKPEYGFRGYCRRLPGNLISSDNPCTFKIDTTKLPLTRPCNVRFHCIYDKKIITTTTTTSTSTSTTTTTQKPHIDQAGLSDLSWAGIGFAIIAAVMVFGIIILYVFFPAQFKFLSTFLRVTRCCYSTMESGHSSVAQSLHSVALSTVQALEANGDQ